MDILNFIIKTQAANINYPYLKAVLIVANCILIVANFSYDFFLLKYSSPESDKLPPV